MKDGLEAEWDREDAEDRNGGVIDLAGTPAGHLVDDTHCLGIERRLDTAQYPHMAYRPVGIDHKTAQHAALDTVEVGIGGITTMLVNELDHRLVTTGKVRLLVHKIIIVHLYTHGLIEARIMIGNRTASLSVGGKRHHRCGNNEEYLARGIYHGW